MKEKGVREARERSEKIRKDGFQRIIMWQKL